jgi:hypothetical protein
MKPWFEKELAEADIIKFPEPKEKVIQMPNVASYPDFITGVQDLQAKQKDGAISQESYDKLYTELIHRFMKKESFETPWYLREAEPEVIQSLAKQVSNLPLDVSDRLISKISNAVNLAHSKDEKGQAMTPFTKVAGSLKNIAAKMPDTDLQKYYKEVARYMLGNGLTSEEITTIIKEINNDSCIKMEELKKQANVLSNIIPTSTISLETRKYYRSLFSATEYGVGPGELLFATHSKSLKKGDKGDLTVIGDSTTREIEVKTKKKQAARFVDRSTYPSSDYISMSGKFITKFQKVLKASTSGVSFNHIHSGITANPKIKDPVLDALQPILDSLFNNKTVTNTIIKMLEQPVLDANRLKSYYAKAVIKRYFDAKEGGMGILFCRLSGSDVETNYAADYRAFKTFAKINTTSTKWAYPVTTDPSYPFPQTDIEV